METHHVDKLAKAACLLHGILIDKEGIDEVTFQKINSEDTAQDASLLHLRAI